ncbi:MAG TPA: ubiquitin-like domain-containing protein [Anaerolineaceae bacterium]|nr:ubiquitin-like domain-containing protein [Anaerolineaceae bacterium]
MRSKTIPLVVAGTVIILGLALVVGLRRTVTIQVDGKAQEVQTYAMTAGWVLHDAGIVLGPADRVTPALDAMIGLQASIAVERAAQVNLYTSGSQPVKTVYSTGRSPEVFLAAADLKLNPGDQLYWNGQAVDPAQVLPDAAQYNLQLAVAHPVTLVVDGESSTVATRGSTLGDGLWQAGIKISPLDGLSAPYNTYAGDSASMVVKQAAPVHVLVDGHTVEGKSAAATVGQALAELGVSLQGLDRSQPTEDQPLPADGTIKIVRVREEIVLSQTTLPFKSETVADPLTELDQIRIVQAGQVGIKVTRQRVTYEDGKEVSRQNEGEWIARQPQNRKIGYGTRVVIHTLDTPGGTIQYYRAVRVYATSFAPCNFIQFIGRCSYTTANGMKLQKGVIGTGEAWYHLFVNQKVYVEGYGTATVGDYGYVPGYWIDLGYSDSDFVNWHGYTMLYFLAPAPKNVPWTLPK